MIQKSFELTKIKLDNYKFYLFYGDNEGLKEENIKNLFEKNYQDKIQRYEEKEILDSLKCNLSEAVSAKVLLISSSYLFKLNLLEILL